MSEEALESPFAVLDDVGDDTGDSAEATPAEATAEEAPAEEAKPESEGEEKAEEAAKPDAEPEPKDGEKKADAEAEEPEPIEGEPPKLKDFISKHKLTGEEKRWLKKEVYTNREFRELFPDIREAKDFRSMYPRPEDWQGAAQTRDSFFRASADFETNPKAFVEGLKSTNAEAYGRVAEVIAADIPTIAPQVRDEIVSGGVVTLLANLRKEAEGNGANWDTITMRELEERLFNYREPPPVDPSIAQIEAENSRLKASQQREDQKNLNAMSSVLDQRVADNMRSEVKKYVDAYAGDGFTEAAKAKIISDLAARVMYSFRNTPSNNHAKKATIDALARGQLKPEQAVASLAARANPELKRLGPDVIRNWTDVVIGANKKAVQKAQVLKAEKAPARRDVPQMATTPPGPVMDKATLLKKDKGDFWNTVFGTA